MTRGDIPCHLFKKTFQSSTSPPDSPLFFPCTPQNLPLLPILASPVIRSSIFLPFSPFLLRPAGESPPARRRPVLISLFAASGGNILRPKCRAPAEQLSAASGKTDITKAGSPQAPGSFWFCPNPVIPRGEAPGVRTTVRRPPSKCAPPVRAPPCAAAGSAAPSTPCAPPPPPR